MLLRENCFRQLRSSQYEPQRTPRFRTAKHITPAERHGNSFLTVVGADAFDRAPTHLLACARRDVVSRAHPQ